MNKVDGVVNTITTMGGGNREPKVFCNVNPSGNGMNGNVYTGDLSPTLTTNKGEGVKILEPQIIAQRGRNPYNPKLKSPGSKTVQMFEKGPEGLSNTLTTVQKDNMLTEPVCLNLKAEGKQLSLQDRMYGSELIAKLHPNRGCIIIDELVYWVRKLIPRECMRLMGANDAQIDRQLEVVSNSQAYKQAGNGIVAQVIGLIIGMLYYEDETELREIVKNNSHSWLKGRENLICLQ